jgi:hypothetical protein
MKRPIKCKGYYHEHEHGGTKDGLPCEEIAVQYGVCQSHLDQAAEEDCVMGYDDWLSNGGQPAETDAWKYDDRYSMRDE